MLQDLCPLQLRNLPHAQLCEALKFRHLCRNPVGLIAGQDTWLPMTFPVLHPSTYLAPGAWMTVRTRIKGDPVSVAYSVPGEEGPRFPP